MNVMLNVLNGYDKERVRPTANEELQFSNAIVITKQCSWNPSRGGGGGEDTSPKKYLKE